MVTDYLPQPLPVDSVPLTEEVLTLVERLAEHAHDVWAVQRLRDGWCYGPDRDDVGKRHPCLVPYSALPDSEKEYDRKVVLGTIRALLALGFVIERAGEQIG